MSPFAAARSMMAMSLGFHILLAVAGMAMPLLMVIAEWRWIATGEAGYLDLAKRWSRGAAILFAVGAVSGTALSFELGLLWPKFMSFSGPMIGLPLSMELYAFFLEAIALGIYLYGWNRVGSTVHLVSGIVVFLSGTSSAVFIVTANAWMNVPVGFDLVGGVAKNVRPWEAMWNPMAFPQTVHMVIAALAAIGFVVAGIHAKALIADGRNIFHRRGLAIALAVGSFGAFVQPFSGDFCAKMVAHYQPVKLAAMEGQWNTERGAGLRIGGVPSAKTETTPYAIEIPKLLSFMATGDPNAEIRGLKAFPESVRPPTIVVHLAFQLMVGLGMLMMGVAALGGLLKLRKLTNPWPTLFLRILVLVGPAGLLAVEAGWVTTEVGRQPWIVDGIMRSADAVTPVRNLIVPLAAFAVLYLMLGGVTLFLLRIQVFDAPRGPELDESLAQGTIRAA
jgi:cytochrome d ubiquinol oxidase subunit I